MPPDLPGRSGRRPLAPSYWGMHLLAVAAVVATVLLGRWQLHVWQDHRAHSSAAVTREAPVPLDHVLGPDAAFPAPAVGRPVVVEGRWDAGRTVYISGRTHQGRTGFWVVTPVVTPSGSAIPVVRGWSPRTADAPAPPRGRAALVGLLQPSQDTGAPVAGRGDVLPELSTTALLQRAPYDLYGGYVVATDRDVPGRTPATGTTGLAAVTPARLPGVDASTALRNLLYAVQWWLFGAFAVFMWWRWLQEDVLGRRPSPEPR